ncbi:MAG TPA: HlyD family type I secretion periplasmic adaptor subunit [Sedimenticola thiotaurini]|uniref:Membrane fusion protein (MFP) family protein n=1 Tax=Sedimenticola thiotaurini TaxID=1543721 RepID=A0A831W4G2_9GAMM|nr:HlyD family type I secretion periplasmic adaptor subunit [Sedimenticola thiotaurini]
MSDSAAAVLQETPRGGRLILWMTVLFVGVALAWASWATLDEVTSGVGQVIPSKHIQVIQNLEGGILAELLVSEGDTVEEGQVLLQIDDTRFSSSLRETRLAYYALRAKAARLQAEASGEAFQVPDEVAENYPGIVAQEQTLYQTRKKELEAGRSILREQHNQIRQELKELEAKSRSLRKTLELAKKELKMTQPLVAAGAVSEVEVLRLRRTVSELEGELESARLAIPRTRSRLAEAGKKIAESELRFRNEAHAELNEVNAELSKLGETSVALEDRVKRTAVRSPVKGTVKQIMVNTIGGVIQPGMDLMEIVPLEDYLLVEARVRPSDIAFLHPGQRAVVKITAYDFAIYGGLDGELEHISADTIKDEVDGESYYLVRVRTGKTHLGSDEHPLPIISGMQAEVDILTGKKSVMDYLLKPVLRARQKALRER